jgi:hypothetical protein
MPEVRRPLPLQRLHPLQARTRPPAPAPAAASLQAPAQPLRTARLPIPCFGFVRTPSRPKMHQLAPLRCSQPHMPRAVAPFPWNRFPPLLENRGLLSNHFPNPQLAIKREKGVSSRYKTQDVRPRARATAEENHGSAPAAARLAQSVQTAFKPRRAGDANWAKRAKGSRAAPGAPEGRVGAGAGSRRGAPRTPPSPRPPSPYHPNPLPTKRAGHSSPPPPPPPPPPCCAATTAWERYISATFGGV